MSFWQATGKMGEKLRKKQVDKRVVLQRLLVRKRRAQVLVHRHDGEHPEELIGVIRHGNVELDPMAVSWKRWAVVYAFAWLAVLANDPFNDRTAIYVADVH